MNEGGAHITGTSGSSIPLHADVCIVGGGFAGLYAAKLLTRTGKRVVLLEARDRVGGRTWTEDQGDGVWIDRGGQWIGTEETEQVLLPRLVKELGFETYPSFHAGDMRVRQVKAPWDLVSTKEDWTHDERFSEVRKALDLMDKELKKIDREKPWHSEDHVNLDRTTFEVWMRTHVSDPYVREMLNANISYACANPNEISMLALLAIIKQCGGFDSLDVAAQATRVKGGMQPVATKLAKSLPPGTVYEKQPVSAIDWNSVPPIVYSKDYQVSAKSVIVTVPPVLAQEINYYPTLPPLRADVTKVWPQGRVVKIAMVYDTPFWRKAGLSGGSLDYKAYAVETADSSTDGDSPKKGILVAFSYTKKAEELMGFTEEKRKQTVLSEMADRFGPEVWNVRTYEETYWTSEEWTKGCYGAFLLPGATDAYQIAIREAIPPLHWAGSETSWIWPTFIEGALRSAERVVKEIP